MLLIWDIHITSKYKERIIEELRLLIKKNTEDDTILFLWDYVYHFSYDRWALLALYQFFIELFEEGKKVYILAGNHDRLGNSFVFEEAQKAFSLVQQYSNHIWEIHFITKPTIIWTQEKILLFPFMLQIPNAQPHNTPNWLKNIEYLKDSSNKNEQKSREINNSLAFFLEQDPNLTIIHHYYFNKTKLPGQKSIFSYKDIALNEELLNNEHIQLISGHLHQSCSYKNYLCTGSIRSTSPLETNQEKMFFIYNTQEKKYTAEPIRINPYLQYEKETKINEATIQEIFKNQIINCKNNYIGNQYIEIKNSDYIPLQYTTLTIIWNTIEYQNINEYIEEWLLDKVWAIKLKKQSINTNELLEKLQFSTQENQSFTDRKQLLKDYINQKYQWEYNEYETILQELKIL